MTVKSMSLKGLVAVYSVISSLIPSFYDGRGPPLSVRVIWRVAYLKEKFYKNSCVIHLTLTQSYDILVFKGVRTMEKLVYRVCADETCGRKVYEHNRIYCWHCINFRKRYKLTHTGVMEKRKLDGKICFLCQEFKRTLIKLENNRNLCLTCKKLCEMMGDEDWRTRLVECV